MDEQAWFILTPYVIALLLSLGLTGYAWRRRSESSARAFAHYALAIVFVTVGALCEMLATSLRGKLFWDDVQFIGMFWVPVMFAIFVHRYTGRQVAHARAYRIGVSIFPVVSILLAFTDTHHGWVRGEPYLLDLPTIDALLYDFTPLFYVMVAYVYAITIYALLLLVDAFVSSPVTYRRSIAFLLAGGAIPFVLAILPVLGLDLFLYRDITPMAMTLGNAVVALGLFRHHILDLVPVARNVVFNAIGEGIVVLDRRGTVIDANAAILEVFGRRAQDVIGRPAAEAFGPWASLVERIRGADRLREEVTAVVNGRTWYAELSVTPLTDALGQPAGRVIVLRDISRRKQAEEALRRAHDELEARVMERTEALVVANRMLADSEARFRLLAENAEDVIYRYRFHPTLGFDYMSPSISKLAAITPDELYQNPFALLEFSHPDDRGRLKRMLEGEIPGAGSYTMRWLGREGQWIWTEHRSALIRDTEGRVIAAEDVARDVTDQVLISQALKESEARYRALFEKANDAIFVARGDKIVQVNRHAMETFGCMLEEDMVGQSVALFSPPTQPDGRDSYAAIGASIARVMQGEALVFEWQHLTCEGIPFDTEVSLSRLDLSDGPAILALVHDITERKRAARELQTLSRSLVEVQEEERAAIARELHDETGQALSYQLLTLSMLQRQAGEPEVVRTRAEDAMRVAEELMDSLHRLVLRLRPSALDHLGLIPAIEQYIETFAHPDLTIHLETAGLDAGARFSPEIETALYRVVQEAITNVVRHARASRVDILLASPSDGPHESQLHLLIEDDGVGFEPTAALRSSRLGLLGMRERVEALGGTLLLESAPGHGTTLRVHLSGVVVPLNGTEKVQAPWGSGDEIPVTASLPHQGNHR